MKNKKYKNILILGIAPQQADAIKYLKARGHTVFAVANSNYGPGKNIADRFDLINITAINRLSEYVNANKISAVYSIGSELALNTIKELSEKFAMPYFGIGSEIANIDNKEKIRKYLQKIGLSSPIFMTGSSISDFKDWMDFPAVLKPVDNQGQRGISKINNIEDIKNQLDYALSFSRNGKAIIESIINGDEYSLLLFIKDYKVIYSFLSARILVEEVGFGIVQSHFISHKRTSQILELIEKDINTLVGAIRLADGPLYIQFIYNETNDDPSRMKVIEFTPRLDGCQLWRLYKHAYGIDILDITFKMLFNEQFDYKEPEIPTKDYSMEYYLQKPGTQFIKDDFELNGKETELEYYYENGEIIRPTNEILEKVCRKIIEI